MELVLGYNNIQRAIPGLLWTVFGRNRPSTSTLCGEIEMRRIAQVLREERLQQGMSQKTLAKRAGLHVNSIQNYESGRRKPTVEIIRSLEAVLGSPLRQLLYRPQSVPREDWINEFSQLKQERLQELSAMHGKELPEVAPILEQAATAAARCQQLERHGLMKVHVAVVERDKTGRKWGWLE